MLQRVMSRFSNDFFLSHSAKNFRRGIFTVALISDSEKIYGQERGGEYQDFPSNSFCLSAEKLRRGIVYCSLISDIEKVYGEDEGGEYQDTTV